MATFTETIKIVIDTSVGTATKGINDLKSSVRDADGVFGKLKAGVQSAGQTLSALPLPVIGAAAATAGAALYKFGQQAVSAFTDGALAADKLARATGLTTEEASKFLAVGDDVGVSAEAIQSAFGKFTKELGANREEYARLGITATNTKDALLQGIDLISRTTDPFKRAELAAKLFGKGWQEVSELVVNGSEKVRSAMESTSEAQIFDKEEVEKAKRLRAASDELGDALGDISIIIGESLVPAVAAAAQGLADLLNNPVVKGAIETLAGGLEIVGTALENLGDWDGRQWADQFEGSVEDLNNTLNVLTSNGLNRANASIAEYEERLRATREELGLTAKELDNDSPWETQKRAALGVRDGMNYAARAAAEYEASQDDAAEATAAAADASKAYAESLNEMAEASDRVVGGFLALPDAIDASAEAMAELVDANAQYNKQPTAENLAKVEKQAKSLADADVALAKATAESTGAVFSQTAAIDAMNASYLKQAATLKGPARQAILDRISQLNGIPAERLTSIEAKIAAGDIAGAEAELRQVSRPRDAAIEAEAYTAEAEAKLNHTARNRRATVSVDVRAGNVSGQVSSAVALAGGRAAQGGVQRFAGGGVVLVGERGPELVGLPDGSNVMPTERVRMWTHQKVSEQLAVTLNGRNVSGMTRAQLKRALIGDLRAYERRNGSGSLFG